MSVIPEYIIQRTIINGFRQIRQDSRVLDAIFRNLSQTQLDAVKQYVLNTSIDFSINYPRKDLSVPSIVLLLRSENEAEAFLGDVMGDGSDNDVPDVDLSIDTLGGHAASISDLSGLERKVKGPLEVDSSSESTVEFADSALDDIAELLEDQIGCLKLYVVAGTGEGQVFNVLRIRSDSLDIDGVFDVQLDSTSLVDLRVPNDPEMAEGEPSRVYDASSDSYLKLGANYEVNYQLNVIAGQQDEVIYLYSVLKAIILSSRQFLEGQGLMALKISGSDFAPRSEYLPSEVFQRVMSLQFKYPFSFLKEQDTYDEFRLNLVPTDSQGNVGDVLVGTSIKI